MKTSQKWSFHKNFQFSLEIVVDIISFTYPKHSRVQRQSRNALFSLDTIIIVCEWKLRRMKESRRKGWEKNENEIDERSEGEGAKMYKSEWEKIKTINFHRNRTENEIDAKNRDRDFVGCSGSSSKTSCSYAFENMLCLPSAPRTVEEKREKFQGREKAKSFIAKKKIYKNNSPLTSIGKKW